MTRPRPCARCGAKPVAYTGREFCYDCVPHLWYGKPPPCKRCGSRTGYYTAGLCERCHRSAPVVGSCLDCLAWGVTRHLGWLCEACRGWRQRHPGEAECRSCSRVVAVNAKGSCRLCCRQAHLVRPPHRTIDIAEANRHGQQLFIADLFRRKEPTPPQPPRQRREAARPSRYPVSYQQLLLFKVARDLAAGLHAGLPPPPLPDLAEALDSVVTGHGAQHGWGRGVLATARAAIRAILATQDTPGAPVKGSEVAAWSQAAFHNFRSVTEVLASAGMLDDDREPTLDAWFSRGAEGLAEPMAEEFRLWYQILRDGSTTLPRARPRSPGTIRQHIASAAPFLHTWTATGHQSLREITREDITAALPADATRQRHALVALRSLFRTLKGRRLIFTNATARLRGAPPALGQPLPLDLGIVRQALHSGKSDRAALAALVAFYALRSRQITSLQLTDIRDGRLHLPDRTILLAQPVREKLADWLTERARRWPATINPHLFINWYTAVRTCPTTYSWVSRTIGASAQAIREDRILYEAQATDGDIRRLCDLFGLTPGGAERYSRTTSEPTRSFSGSAGEVC